MEVAIVFFPYSDLNPIERASRIRKHLGRDLIDFLHRELNGSFLFAIGLSHVSDTLPRPHASKRLRK